MYAMRHCGKGYQGVQRFLALFNHPPAMTEKYYRKISHSFTEAVPAVALEYRQDISNKTTTFQGFQRVLFYM